MDKISLILEQELLKHVVEKSHMLSEAEEPMYKVGDNVTAWIQGGAPAKYKISGIAHIKVPIGDLKKGDAIYIAKKGNRTFYLTDADMRDPMNEKTLRPNGDVEDGDILNDMQEDTLYIEAMSAAQAKAAHKKFKQTGELPPHLKKLVKDLDKIKLKYKVKNIVVPGLEWMANIQEAKRINRNQAKLYEKGLKKVAKSVTFAKAAKQDGNIKLFVNYTKYTDRAKLKKAGEQMGLTYLSDGRVTNRPSAAPIGGGVLGIQNNWMKFAKEA